LVEIMSLYSTYSNLKSLFRHFWTQTYLQPISDFFEPILNYNSILYLFVNKPFSCFSLYYSRQTINLSVNNLRKIMVDRGKEKNAAKMHFCRKSFEDMLRTSWTFTQDFFQTLRIILISVSLN